MKVVLYRSAEGAIPLLEWLQKLPKNAVSKCIMRIGRLRQLGYEIRRPDADYLRDDIYELRVSLQGIQYRILYFYCGQSAIVLSHGIIKKQRVSDTEINAAIRHKYYYLENPNLHSWEFDIE